MHTPGPWKWWTSNSWRRLTSHAGGRSGQDGGVLCPTTQASDGHPDIIATEDDMALIAAAPDLLSCCELARLALKSRDQSEYEANILAAINLAITKATTPVSR
jgi:hypothetical protein